MSKRDKPDAIRIAVVDDHPLMRGGIIAALEAEADFEVVGDGQSTDDAIAIAERLLPDVMLIDINMPGGGLTALQRIAATCPAVVCVVTTVREDEETVVQALRLGARGYVLKGIGGRELAATLRSIHRGEAYITPALAARLIAGQVRPPGPAVPASMPSLAHLTEREVQILELISKGMINKHIGGELGLSEKTVKHYVTNILQKLQVSNRVEAALVAHRGKKTEG